MNTFLRFSALLILLSFWGGSSALSQTIYSEDFQNESPNNANNLCPPNGTAYTPPDGNWTLGSACPNQTNGRPQLAEDNGDVSFRIKRRYLSSSEVWKSKTISVAFLDEVIVSLDAASKGGLEDSGNNKDSFKIFIALDGAEQPNPIISQDSHVDGAGGGNRTATASFSESVDVSGASTMTIIFKAKISSTSNGGANAESYFLDNVTVCGDSDSDDSCDVCDPLEFDTDLSSYTVQCMSDLPTACNETVGSNRGVVTCGLLEERLTAGNYTTSTPDGSGSDWMLILYGSENDEADIRKFSPSGDGVTLTEFENGTVKLSGKVVDNDDPSAILNIQTIFGEGMSGTDWPGLFKADNACGIVSTGDATTDAWEIYQMESGLSYLTGEGSLDGSYVQLAHMPEENVDLGVPTFGFQIGEGANNRGCNFGAGGWFFYSGQLGGESISNGTGDFAFDLTASFETLNPCNAEGESNVTLVYTIQDLACGQVLTTEQVITRLDDTDPTFDNAPSDTTVTCAQTLPEAVLVTASDNCDDAGFPTVTYEEPTEIPGDCPQEYTVLRQWTAVDCSGNSIGHTQTISVVDSIAPVITGGLNDTVECDGLGNTVELQFFLDSHGGASASDDCGDVSWSYAPNPAVLSDLCGATGTVAVDFIATDECGNASSKTISFTIRDTTKPTFENAFEFTYAACEDLLDPTDPTQVPITASDFCGDVTYSIEVSTLSGGCPNTYQRIWTATDECGNVSEVSEQYVELYDNTKPTLQIQCPEDYVADAAADCTAQTDTATTGAATAEASDNCATDLEIEITYSDADTTSLCEGQFSFTRTWKATTEDDCDNSEEATCEQLITINDNTDPVIETMAMDTTAECDGFGNNDEFYAWLANAGGAAATDACSEVTWTNDYATYQPADADFGGTYGPDSWTLIEQGIHAVVEFSEDGSEIYMNGPEDYGLFTGSGVVKACQPARQRLSVSFDWAYDLGTYFPNTGASFDPAFYLNDEKFDLTEPDFWGNEDQSGTMIMVVEQGDLFGWGIESYILGGFGGAELVISNFSTEVLASQDPCQDEQRIVTFTASDDCGNTSASTASFYIEDTTDPEITALAETSVACDLYDADTEYDFSASDICSGTDLDVQISDLPQSGPCAGQISRTYTVTDACGNDAEAMQVITLIDTVKPMITCPGDTTTECGASNMAQLSAWLANVTASDNCDTDVEIDNDYGDENELSDLCGATGSVTVTWTATDHCNNAETCSATFTIQDTTNPEIINEASGSTVQCDGSGNATQLSEWLNDNGGASATDECGEVTWSYSPNPAEISDECGATGSVTVTFTATDECNNFSTSEATFIIEDTIDPEVTTMAMDTTAECDGFGNNDEFYAWLANAGGAAATDACSEVTWTNDYATYQPADADFGGTYGPDSWTLIEQGIHAVVEFSEDGSEIYMNGPEDYGLFTGSGVVKACQPARQRLSVSFDWAYDLGTYFPNTGASFDPAFYLNDEKFDLTEPDFWGNEDQSGTMIMVVEQGDLFGWGIESYILGGFGGAELVISNFSTEVLASQDPCQDEQRIVTFTASDDCENTGVTTTASFYIEDTTDPEITALAETSVACDLYDADTEYDFSASDICSGTDLDVQISDLPQSGPCAGQISRTYTVTDACGNDAEAMQVITLIDTVKPMITCPGDTTTECGASNMAQLSAWLANVTASDNCDTDVEIDNDYGDENELSDLCGATGSVTVTWTATDHCNNAETCSATFTIQDTTNPEIINEASGSTVQCDGSGNATQLSEWLNDNGGASATDECGEVTWSYSPNPAEISDECGATGSVTVTFTATDECNNFSTSEATFIIEDTIDPEVTTMAMDTTAECDGFGNNDEFYAWLANAGGAAATDACSEVTWTNDYATYQPADADFGGTYGPDSWTLIEQGIHAVVEFSEDGSEIYMNGPEDYGLFTGSGVVKACQPARQRLSVSFDWAYDLGTYFPNTGASFDPAFYLNDEKFDLTEPDFWGNEDQSGTMIMVVEQGDLFGWGIESYILGGFGGAELVISNFSTEVLASQDPCQDEQRIVTFTASDDCENTGVTTTASFYIEDTTDPEITALAETSVACDLYDADTEYDFSASDICSGTDLDVQISDVPQSGPCAGKISRTYTVTDACGNDAEAMQVITLIDTVKPTFDLQCPLAEISISADADDCSADTSVETNGSASFSNEVDNCDTEVDMDVSYDDSQVDGCAGSYVITRVWTVTATDHCDNVTSKTCTQTITVTDDTAPTIGTAASPKTVECDGSGNNVDLMSWLNNNGGASATDACGEVTWSYSPNPAELSDECGATGSVTVTFTATDECNNTRNTSATFTIEDTTDPTLTIEGPANKDLYVDASCYVDTTVATIGGITYEANDNCGDVSVVVTSVDSEISMTCEDSDDVLQGSYSFERTFTATATDECERTTEKTYTQIITVSDTISPQFTNTCDLTNGDAVSACCTTLSGTVLIPEACEPSADDNCDSQVNIDLTEVYVGDYAPQPGSGVVSYCESSTPEAFEDGEACNGMDPHSFSLFNFDGEARVDFVSDGVGTVAQMEDGSWVLTQNLVPDNGGSVGSAGLTLSVTYNEAVGWDEWYVAGQTNYKRDCGLLIDDHENWDYRIMEGGTIDGTGDYSGLSLSLSHAPANEYYAMQVGVGANNQNNNYGYSGWIMASGTYNSESVFFSGDLFGDLDCCLPWSIERDYIASDDCENSTPFGYTIEVNGPDCADDAGADVSGAQEGDHGPAVLGGAGDVMTGKSPIRVTNLMPNPTNDLSMLGFTVTENMRLRVDMYTMDGVLVSQLYDGVASPNVNNTLNIEAGNLQSGMYQIRLSSSQYLVVKKLLVAD